MCDNLKLNVVFSVCLQNLSRLESLLGQERTLRTAYIEMAIFLGKTLPRGAPQSRFCPEEKHVNNI